MTNGRSAKTTDRLPRTRHGNPRLTHTGDVLAYWAERIHLVDPPYERFGYGSMICEGDSLYHYGHHFELARILRDKRGRTRLVLLNGDRYAGSGGWGPSTSSRQGDVRHAVAVANVSNIVLPFSALAGAGIDFETIAPIHVRADRNTTEEHSSHEQPHKKLAWMEDPSGATRTETYYGCDPESGKWRSDLERQVLVLVDNPNLTRDWWAQRGWSDGARRGEDGIWRWRVSRHWLGDSIFRARNERVPFRVTRWATYLSSFDYQESAPLYFLCELPYRAKPRTVEEAIEMLKPPEVVAAQARGLKVIRQGDLFAIPTKLTKRQVRHMARGSFTNRLRVLGTNHSVTEGVVCKGGAVLGRGIMRHEPDRWRTPDHARQKLGDGKTWYLLVRNTVPQIH